MDEILVNTILKTKYQNNENNHDSSIINTLQTLIHFTFLTKPISHNWNHTKQIKIKYNVLKTRVIQNIFLTKQQKNQIIQFFGIYNHFLFSITFLKRRYKMRNMKVVTFDHTLSMKNMSDIPDNHIVNICENNTTFKLYIFDVRSIIINALQYQRNLFVEPLPPKNPYTNIKFTTSTLYTIYFKLKNENILPTIIHNFMRCHFDIKLFKSLHFIELQKNAIQSYLKEKTKKEKFDLIKTLLKKYCSKTIHFLGEDIINFLIKDCYLLIFSELATLCFDDGYYDIQYYYENIRKKELKKIKSLYRMYFIDSQQNTYRVPMNTSYYNGIFQYTQSNINNVTNNDTITDNISDTINGDIDDDFDELVFNFNNASF